MCIVIGVDPGISGAIAFIDTARETCTVHDLPTMPLPGDGLVKRKIDARGLIEIIRANWGVAESALAFVEQVGAMGGKDNAVQTQVSLGRTLGAIEAVLEVLRLPPTMVPPQSWKRQFGLGSDKAKARETALKLFPGAAADLKRVKDHNRAEAILIARYGAMKYAF